jgi:hypothetical protein
MDEALRLFAPHKRHRLEELAQPCTIRVVEWEHCEDQNRGDHFKAWLITIDPETGFPVEPDPWSYVRMNYHKALPIGWCPSQSWKLVLTTVDYARQFNTEYCVFDPTKVMPPWRAEYNDPQSKRTGWQCDPRTRITVKR